MRTRYHRTIFPSLLFILAITPLARSAEPVAADPAEQVFELDELKQSGKPPKPIKQGGPVYPQVMSREGVTGGATISFIIDRTGKVRNVKAVESSNPWFEGPAINAVKRWEFTPGEMNGRPVSTHVDQRIDFNLVINGQDMSNRWRVAKGRNFAKLPPEFQWDTPPVPLKTGFPVYPFEQLQAGVEGKARISYIVGPAGQVLQAKLGETSTPEFGQAVLAMIDTWKFKPAMKKDGTPCYANLNAEYDFRKNGRSDVPVSAEAREILQALAKKSESIVDQADLDQPLKPESRRWPVYPTALVKMRQPGQAVIEFFVDRRGGVQLPRIVSSTAPEFGHAAVQAVALWRYEAPRKAGKTVVTRVQIPVNFSLEAGQPRAP